MEMVKRVLICVSILASTSAAADFSLTIGNPIAAAGPDTSAPLVKKVSKTALFAVRFEECRELDKAQINGVAEGIADGARVSAPVLISAASPGTYVVNPGWNQAQGVWVVSLSASCGTAKAAALVPIGPQGFIREKIKQLSRPATKPEIEAALAAIK